jgi:isopenicillin-N epimerase
MRVGRAAREMFALEEGMAFLNHGSYGAVPKAVTQAQEIWRRRMEAQPVRFFLDEAPGATRVAAGIAARFVGTAPERFGFVENASQGTGAVMASLRLAPGDRIVTTDHVYNALRNALRHHAARAGADVVEVPLGLPVTADEIVAQVTAALDARVRLLVIDHVASASAIVFPVHRLVAAAHARGVPVLVDGAHGPGLLDLDVDALGADVYVGNFHKWVGAPRGAAFVAVSPTCPIDVHPLVISHAYGQGFAAEFDKIGTRDLSPWLAVPDAIRLHEDMGGAALRARNTGLAREQGARVAAELGSPLAADASLFAAMATIALPAPGPVDRVSAFGLRGHIWARHRVEVPVMVIADRPYLRISAAVYNEASDYDGLAAAVRDVLPLMKAAA